MPCKPLRLPTRRSFQMKFTLGLDVCTVADTITAYNLIAHLWQSKNAVSDRFYNEYPYSPLPSDSEDTLWLFEMSQNALQHNDCWYRALITHVKYVPWVSAMI